MTFRQWMSRRARFVATALFATPDTALCALGATTRSCYGSGSTDDLSNAIPVPVTAPLYTEYAHATNPGCECDNGYGPDAARNACVPAIDLAFA